MQNHSLIRELKGCDVLVTGATGFTGTVLLKKLVSLGANVRAIARKSSNISEFEGLPIQWLRGEVYNPEIAAEAAKGVQYIFHVAAAFRQAGIDDSEYYKVHVESTKLLAEAAVSGGVCKRFIHTSTMGVHGHIENPPGDENSPYGPGDIYQETKLEGELWFRDFAKKNNLPFTVVRPTAIYGPGDRRLLKIFKMACWPLFPILGYGKCLYHLVHVEDLTDAMLLCAVHPNAKDEIFLVGSNQAIALEDMARIVASEYCKKLRVLRIPIWPFFAAAAVCETVCPIFGIEPPLYRRRVAFYSKDRSFSTAKLQKALSFACSRTDEEGIRETARWYADHGWINNKQPTACCGQNQEHTDKTELKQANSRNDS